MIESSQGGTRGSTVTFLFQADFAPWMDEISEILG